MDRDDHNDDARNRCPCKTVNPMETCTQVIKTREESNNIRDFETNFCEYLKLQPSTNCVGGGNTNQEKLLCPCRAKKVKEERQKLENVGRKQCNLPACSGKSDSCSKSAGKSNDICEFLLSQPAPEWTKNERNKNSDATCTNAKVNGETCKRQCGKCQERERETNAPNESRPRCPDQTNVNTKSPCEHAKNPPPSKNTAPDVCATVKAENRKCDKCLEKERKTNAPVERPSPGQKSNVKSPCEHAKNPPNANSPCEHAKNPSNAKDPCEHAKNPPDAVSPCEHAKNPTNAKGPCDHAKNPPNAKSPCDHPMNSPRKDVALNEPCKNVEPRTVLKCDKCLEREGKMNAPEESFYPCQNAKSRCELAMDPPRKDAKPTTPCKYDKPRMVVKGSCNKCDKCQEREEKTNAPKESQRSGDRDVGPCYFHTDKSQCRRVANNNNVGNYRKPCGNTTAGESCDKGGGICRQSKSNGRGCNRDTCTRGRIVDMFELCPSIMRRDPVRRPLQSDRRKTTRY